MTRWRQGEYYVFLFNETEKTEIYTLSLHDALPIFTSDDLELLTKTFTINGEGSGWQTGTMNLGNHRGPLTAHFSIEGHKNREAFCALSEVSLQQLGEDPPTVLLITSDTHRADYVGFSNAGVEVRTPILDALAKSGLVFKDCATSTNVTNPSHVALMTGMSVVQTALVGNDTPLAQVAPTLAEAFREGGFATWAALSANHLGHSKSGLGQGFERMSTPTAFQRNSPDTIAELIRWLPDADGQPLFLWLHLFDVHAPYAPPDEWKNMYYPEGADPYDESLPILPNYASPKCDRQVRDLAYFEALYRSEITYVDGVLAGLLARPGFEGAVSACTADHGETLERGMEEPFGHLSLTFNTLAVPLIVVAPGLEAGEVRGAPVQQLDLGRTLLNLAGHAGVEFPGEDLFAVEVGIKRPRFGVQANGEGASVLHGRWLLVLNLSGELRDWGPVEETRHAVRLFDLERDPYCERDALAEHSREAGRLRAMLIDWLGEGAQNDWLSERGADRLEIERQLEELGYTASGGAGSAGTWIDPKCPCARCAAFDGIR